MVGKNAAFPNKKMEVKKKMAKNFKRELLCVTVFIIVLLCSSVYAVLTPNVYAAETTIQENLPVSLPENVTKSAIEEKGLAILSNVFSLDMAKYATASKEGQQDLYMNAVPEENVHYTFQSDDSSVDMLCTFANGNLRMLNVLESKGAVNLTKIVTKPLYFGNMTLQVVDLVGTAKGFLGDYQSFSGKAFYGELSGMLENVDADENSTKVNGNVKLEVSASGSATVFKWTYIFDGIEAPDKCVAIGYKNGFLKYFIDNWDLYKIGSTNVNLSEKEAIDIAMEHAKTFSWNMNSDNDAVKITNFKVTNAMIWETIFCSNLYADKPRSEDPLMLYPVRHVWVSLDKFYPGNVYGFNVYVWADTGEVCAIHERVATMDPPADLVASANDFTIESSNNQVLGDEVKSNSMSLTWITPVFAVVMLGTVPAWFLVGKKKNLLKRSSPKIGGILFCLLISSTVLLVPISAVNAECTRGALIWGSESLGAWNTDLGFSWRKTPGEVGQQNTTSNAISNYFRDDGYDAKNYKGNGSNASQIIANISDSALQHSLVAVVDFDHGIGRPDSPSASGEFHYMFEDQNGTIWGPDNEHKVNHAEHGVYDAQIYPLTGSGKNFFTLINTCMSGNVNTWTYTSDTGAEYPVGQGFVNGTNAQGMPFAWTHRIVRAKGAGFNTNNHMSIDGYGDPDDGAFCYIGFYYGSAALNQTISGIAPIYATWLENFFWYALSFDISVNDALDEASLRNFNDLFGDTDLATGFTAVWPMYINGAWQYSGTGISGPGAMVVYGNGNIHLYEYFVHDYISATGDGFYWGIENPDNIEGGSNDGQYTHMYAYFDPSYGPSQALLRCNIGWDATGHIYLYGYATTTSCLQVWVSSDYSTWYEVDSFTVDPGSPQWIDVGSYANKFRYIAIVVYPFGNVYLDSVLVIPQQQQSQNYWVSKINATYSSRAGFVSNPDGLKHSYNDGSFVQIYGANPGDGGNIDGEMNAVSNGHIYLWGYSAAGYSSHLYVFVSYYHDSGWVQASVQSVDPSEPHWIDCNSGSNFRYIAIVAINDNGMRANLFVDSVKVIP